MYTCAEMTSSEIANLQLVVNAKKIKTFCTMKRVCKQWTSTNSTNINKTNNYLLPQIIELVEKLFVILTEKRNFAF